MLQSYIDLPSKNVLIQIVWTAKKQVTPGEIFAFSDVVSAQKQLKYPLYPDFVLIILSVELKSKGDWNLRVLKVTEVILLYNIYY